MDPLSITASILTLTTLISSALHSVQSLRDARGEVSELRNELVDLGVVGREFARAIASDNERSQNNPVGNSKLSNNDTHNDESDISILLDRCKGKLEELQHILNRIIGSDGRPITKIGAKSRIIWLREKSKVEAIRRELNGIKLSLVAVLEARTSINISKLHLRLDGISLVDSTARDTPTIQDADSHDLIVTQATTPDATQTITRLFQSPNTRTILLHTSQSACPKWCSCLCHKTSRRNSPRLLNDLFGALSINYSGVPYLSNPCNEKRCTPNPSTSAKVVYQFPSWLLSRALSMLIVASNLHGPEMQLRTLRVVPASAHIFRFALAGDVEGIKTLLQQGQASIYDVDDTRWSILHKAFLNGQTQVCKFLLEQGADASIEAMNGSSVVERAWHSDRTKTGFALTDSQMLFDVLKSAGVEAMLETQQYTIIHKIVLNLSPLDLETQLQHSTATIDAVDARGKTPLWWAAARGDTDSVRLLLEYGAACKDPLQPDSHSALHVAQTPEVVQLLVQYGAEIDCRDEQQRTPLQCCAYRGTSRGGSLELLEGLLDCGADIHAKSVSGNTALHYAVQFGWLEHTKLLIDRGADLEAKKVTGRTPLMEVVSCSHMDSDRFVDVARLLVLRGASLATLNDHGRNILHLVAERGDQRMMRGLILIIARRSQQGATDAQELNADGVDSYGFTPKNVFDQRRVASTESGHVLQELESAFNDLLKTVRRRSECDTQIVHCSGSTDTSTYTDSDDEDEDVFEDAQHEL